MLVICLGIEGERHIHVGERRTHISDSESRGGLTTVTVVWEPELRALSASSWLWSITSSSELHRHTHTHRWCGTWDIKLYTVYTCTWEYDIVQLDQDSFRDRRTKSGRCLGYLVPWLEGFQSTIAWSINMIQICTCMRVYLLCFSSSSCAFCSRSSCILFSSSLFFCNAVYYVRNTSEHLQLKTCPDFVSWTVHKHGI